MCVCYNAPAPARTFVRSTKHPPTHTHTTQEFEAGEEGCAILDVLIPPYDPMQGRPCNYYRWVLDCLVGRCHTGMCTVVKSPHGDVRERCTHTFTH